jgi:tRNA(Ser,Leu) C12 N-acetylase TAN1
VTSQLSLILTTAKGQEAKASAEFKEIALQYGVRKFQIEKSPYDGMLEVEMENARAFISFLREYVRSEPFRVHSILRLIPVDAVVDTNLEQIGAAAKELSNLIGAAEKFRITVESRDSPYTTKQLIDAIAAVVDRDVSLEAPDKIFQVEVLGEYTALSVLSPDDVLSIVKLKRAS